MDFILRLVERLPRLLTGLAVLVVGGFVLYQVRPTNDAPDKDDRARYLALDIRDLIQEGSTAPDTDESKFQGYGATGKCSYHEIDYHSTYHFSGGQSIMFSITGDYGNETYSILVDRQGRLPESQESFYQEIEQRLHHAFRVHGWELVY